MSKIIYSVPKPRYDKEPQWWYMWLLRQGSIVERRGIRWRLYKGGYSWTQYMFGDTAHWYWQKTKEKN